MAQDDKPQPSASAPQPSLKERVSRAHRGRRRPPVALGEAEGARRPAVEAIRVRLRRRAATAPPPAASRTSSGNAAGASGTGRSTLSDKEFVSLLKKVQPALDAPVETPSFLPDTLIGILEISDGTAARRIYFAADPEQARTQGKVPPREVLEAVDAVYAVGASLSGTRNIKP